RPPLDDARSSPADDGAAAIDRGAQEGGDDAPGSHAHDETTQRTRTLGPTLDPTRVDALRQLASRTRPGLLDELIDTYLRQLPARREALKRHLQTGDTEDFGAVLHSLKGSSANMGLVRISRYCAQLEATVRQSTLAQLDDDALLPLERALDRGVRALHALHTAIDDEPIDDADAPSSSTPVSPSATQPSDPTGSSA
ncbi:MAG: Hpt domain-containing protein, partial [Acidobacteriota bacterium]